MRELDGAAYLILLNPLEAEQNIRFQLTGCAELPLIGAATIQTESQSQHSAHIAPLSASVFKWNTQT